MKQLILIVCCIGLLPTGCEKRNPAEIAIDADLAAGKPIKVATAPDGTNLWRVVDVKGSGKEIFFSSKGTFNTTSELQGKTIVTKEHAVPNAE